MTMKLTDGFENFQAKKKTYADAVTAGAGVEEQQTAYSDMMDSLQDDLTAAIEEQVNSQVKSELDGLEANRRVDSKMTAAEMKFFNEFETDTTNKNEIILPEDTRNEIFEDLKSEHPLLAELDIKDAGLRLKILKSDTKGAAVWGDIFGEIKGQLDQIFKEDTAKQSKLTAFVVVPNDALEYGAAWLKQYVVTQIVEVFAVALEEAFLTGDGNQKPIGLAADLSKGKVTDGKTTYAQKEASVKLTLTDSKTTSKELGALIKKLSVKENGKPIVAKGKTVIVVQPGASIDFEAAGQMQNVNGQWVYGLPFGIKIVESVFVPENKAIAFVKGRYDAYTGGNVVIKTFDQTLALEDMTLYTAKQFAYGKAKDNNATAVLDLSGLASTTTGSSTASTPAEA